MLALTSPSVVYLSAAGRQRSRVLPSNAKEQNFRDVAKIEADASAIGPAIFPELAPNDHGLIIKAPCGRSYTTSFGPSQ